MTREHLFSFSGDDWDDPVELVMQCNAALWLIEHAFQNSENMTVPEPAFYGARVIISGIMATLDTVEVLARKQRAAAEGSHSGAQQVVGDDELASLRQLRELKKRLGKDKVERVFEKAMAASGPMPAEPGHGEHGEPGDASVTSQNSSAPRRQATARAAG